MYELRYYDGFGYIGYLIFIYCMSEDIVWIFKYGYYVSVSYVDVLLGDLMNYLKVLDFYENIIIVVWGDYGWKLGDYNSWGKMMNFNIDL